jgi:hypothetical protein
VGRGCRPVPRQRLHDNRQRFAGYSHPTHVHPSTICTIARCNSLNRWAALRIPRCRSGPRTTDWDVRDRDEGWAGGLANFAQLLCNSCDPCGRGRR